MRGSVGNDGRGLGAVGVSLLCVLTLAGCADAFVGMSLPSLPKLDDVSPFAEKQVPLPGKRVSVIQQEKVTSNLAAADRPIMLPPQQQNDSWSQPGGAASNAPGHLAFAGAGKSAWSVDAGTGCFMDPVAGQLLAARMDREDEYFNVILDELQRTYRHTRSWLDWRPSPEHDVNIICFSSGWGDGHYPSFFGFSSEGELCSVLTDFLILSETENAA